MQAGAVAYHDRKKVKRVMVKKNRELTKKLEKTKSVDTAVDHVKLRRIRDNAEMKLKKKFYKEEMQRKKLSRKKTKKRHMQKVTIDFLRETMKMMMQIKRMQV